MKSKVIVVLAVLVFLIGSAVPSDAARRGGRSHGGSHGPCCWWGPGAVIGGLALGAALAYPYYAHPYYASPYYASPYYTSPYYAYPYYAPPAIVAPPMVYQQQPAPQAQPGPAYQQQPLVQREVVYPNGKYVLYGDGVTQPWEWVWVAAPR